MKVITGNNVFIVLFKVTVTSCSFFTSNVQYVRLLLLDDALKPATPLTNGAINETLRQFAPLSDETLEVWWDLSSDSIITNFLLILTVK